MFDANTPEICTKRCWQVGLAAGSVLTLILWMTGRDFLPSLLVGIFAFTAVGMVLIMFWCMDKATPEKGAGTQTAHDPKVAGTPPVPRTPEVSAPVPNPPVPTPPVPNPPSAAVPEPIGIATRPTPPVPTKKPVEPADAKSDVDGEPVIKASQPLPGQQELSERKGTWRYEASNKATETAATGPAMLSSAREGGADDLKKIKGVGPKLESLLNSKGFYHFDQIATWSETEIAWVDENLEGFKGRVSRDGWVEQAKILASGGETEFSKRKS